jgi:3-dehydroquinate synthase
MDYLEQSFSVKFEYRVYFTSGFFQRSNELLDGFFKKGLVADTKQKVFFVVDQGVSDAFPELVESIKDYFKQYPSVRLAGEPLVIPGG